MEVMRFVGEKIDVSIDDYLKPVETNWQPADLLPDSTSENFLDEVKLLRESTRELSYDYVAVLVGDTITEEALPNYETWFMGLEGHLEQRTWAGFMDALGPRAGPPKKTATATRSIKLPLPVGARQYEGSSKISTQYLIADGFDIGTGRDPYRNFIYTSFQELATNVSHSRTATLAKQAGCNQLSKICGVIASDEMRHAKAYKAFVSQIFEVDPSEMMLAFEDMMRKKIVMPAHFLRETGVKLGETFSHFSDAAQRLGVYTTQDYIDIAESLLNDWNIGAMNELNDAGQRARDYLMALPARLRRVAERTKIPALEYPFSWIAS